MEKIRIDGAVFRTLIEYGFNCLMKNKKIVNELNVFPIPDGDTGDNMCLTLEGGLNAIKDKSTDNISEMARTCSDGMINSARGNSGVILSQLFFGFAKGLRGLYSASISDVVSAMATGVKQGYLAVDKPTEGTMLTVAKDLAQGLCNLDLKNIEVEEFAKIILEITKKSVERTPDQLDILKANGVVDSGGAGLYYIIEGCCRYLQGEIIEDNPSNKYTKKDVDYSHFNEDSIMQFGYCSEIMLQLTRKKTDIDNFNLQALKDFLNNIGDSLVVFQSGYVIKIHIHTFEPHKLLEYCSRYGEFLEVKIENMTLQHSNIHIENNFSPNMPEARERKKYGVVAVASGEGIVKLFKDFGADVIIDGGQTNNPSVNDFIQAFEKTNSEVIFVLTNNSNVILTAKQSAKNFNSSKIHIIETKNIGEGYAVLSMLDFTSDDDEKIVNNMYKEISNTTTGAITRANKSSKYKGVNILKDDYIGLINNNIVTANSIRIRAVFDLLDNMLQDTKDDIVLIFGKNFTLDERKVVREYILSKNYDIEIYEIDGNQEIYDLYII